MKDLYRSLDEYPEELLVAIATAWGIALPKDEPIRMVKRLGDEMLSPDAIAPVLASLSPPAEAALAYLMARGGATPARPTALRYGALRRFGPARLRREKPWLAPQGPLEELYYKGLVYRAYGQVGNYYGDLVLIPADLAACLPPLEVATAVGDTERLDEPAHRLAAGQALLDDLLATIVHLRQQPLVLAAHRTPMPQDLAPLALGKRLLGGAESSRLQTLWRSLVCQDLIEHDGRQWRPALAARQWLNQSDAEQWLATFRAWRDDEAYDELLYLPTIDCEPDGWQNRPAQARRRFCTILAAYEAGVWYDLESLMDALREHHPDYLRPDGDMDSWLIRDAETGDSLRGMDSWDAVEKALARHWLTGPLHWLGIADLGFEERGAAPSSLRLTSAGEQLLSGERPPESAAADEPLAHIDEQMAVRISTRNTRYQRYQLERLAIWQGQNEDVARYLLTEDSIWQSQNTGIQGGAIRSFLRRITGDALPDPVEDTLAAWTERFGRVSVRRAVVLETVDEATMQQIRQAPELGPLLGASLSPTMCLIGDQDLDELIAGLKRHDIWPRIMR